MANLVASATLRAVTVTGFAGTVAGAVYRPELEIVPAVALHVTRVSEVLDTVAVNLTVRRTRTVADVGVIETEIGEAPVTAMWNAAETCASGFVTVRGIAVSAVDVVPEAVSRVIET